MHCIRVWGARIQGGLHIFSYTKHFKNLWNRIAKFWNYCLYVRFAIPLCGSLFFGGVTPYGLMGWNRALQKNNFSSSEKMFFFAHAWTASNPRNIVFPNNLMKTALARKKPSLESSPRPRYLSPTLCRLSYAALGKKAIFQAPKNCFFPFALNDEMEWTRGLKGPS